MSSLDTIDALYKSLREVTNEDVELFEDKITKLDFDKDSKEPDLENIRNIYLKPTNNLSWGLLDLVQNVPSMNFLDEPNGNDTNQSAYDYKDLFQLPEPIKRTAYYFKRRGIEGHIDNYKEEVNLKEIANANASNSLSLTRTVNAHGNFISGSSSQLPFAPGGVVMGPEGTRKKNTSAMSTATKLLHKDDQGLFDIPTGFERGILPQLHVSTTNDQVDTIHEIDSIDNEIANKEEIEQLYDNEDNLVKELTQTVLANQPTTADLNEIDDLLPIGIEFGRTVKNQQNLLERKEWAHVVDLNHKIENFSEMVPNPARTWPFELDTFQKEAVYHLEQGDSVFVAAHTSAGKTVVAEYAIAMSKRNMTKTIYTSPIKALSNQKFRDFKETFDDIEIGLITGDVQINPEANCLIMTTEILRSMLYRGADLIRDVEFVIFDEVHYVNDQDRGVVWEEVIIMLPQHVKFILLSATVPNTYEFANWIGRTKQKNIYVISTPKRPVPLEINIWAKNTLIPVINSKREFLEANFKKHKQLIEGVPSSSKPDDKKTNNSRGGSIRGGSRRGGSTRGGSSTRGNALSGSRGAGAVGSNKSKFFRRGGPNKKTWPDIINFLKGRELLPVVIFVFSKKRCEDYADYLESLNFCNNREKSQIHMFIEKSITRLKKEDRELPQILKIRSLLERGIAVHHGGLLPIVKELIEILFSKGLIRVLFATETFAMGLNLPTRTVIFSEIQKHDGVGLRDLNPGEFTQMAGRAGRRGLDDTGTVIVMAYNDPLQSLSFKEVTLGVPTKLESQFKLTYNMILNLLRIEALKVEEMIKYSFSENTKQTLLPEHEKKIKELQESLSAIKDIDCAVCGDHLDSFLNDSIRYSEVTANMMEELTKTGAVFYVLKAGRLILFRDIDGSAKLGFIYSNNVKAATLRVISFTSPNILPNGQPNHLPYLSSIAQYCNRYFNKFKSIPFTIEEISVSAIEIVSPLVLKVPFTQIINGEPEAMAKLHEEIKVVLRIAPKLKESKTEKRGNLKVHQSLVERANIKERLENSEVLKCDDLYSHFEPKYKKFMIEKEIKGLYHLMSDQNLNLLPDYEKRLSVLKATGFIDQNHNVMLKGRVACEINSGYELVITELILDNFLGDFEPEEIVALLSVFIYEGRTKDEEPPIGTPRLAKGKKKIEEIYKKMLNVYEAEQIPLTREEAEFLDMKRFALMNVVYEWARGLSFKEIMEISVEQEGTVVRVITRLDEICRQVKTAAIIIGNSNLHQKMTQAQELIKRDIVFAASLYL
ncbi:hypothetical protein Kpol_1055p74 [Vanderwaltozyma polyspora DSM 70294]|uniref:Antiviral helicase SKI2 n=1 Tax=Vanderwaltozyma polyspora (strain ATCC 22028 / DSM 70294 / BCRC 21397 / CBS 2163 / NBRC 10782 / NRRL Y-8283 / UCD 57-17) TaxID=436907 RepID=A7TGE7_VANPO|nr:uncharacterized protein Kpol_1055p74 [Vanderwaltozyma polyspora DSM 70294]EDO18717.1 hypothetical protein Kpol_1055p74 [Vanderwaltozyma polyspora DSM 70294]